MGSPLDGHADKMSRFLALKTEVRGEFILASRTLPERTLTEPGDTVGHLMFAICNNLHQSHGEAWDLQIHSFTIVGGPSHWVVGVDLGM